MLKNCCLTSLINYVLSYENLKLYLRHKLMDKAAYGEFMEKLEKTIHVRLVSNKKDYFKWSSKTSYISQKIFDNDLVAIRKNNVTLKKAAHDGMCILDLSKVLMCEFHYDYIKDNYVNSARLLFTDTDSLIYKVKTEDVYKDFSKDKEMFGFSHYSP